MKYIKSIAFIAVLMLLGINNVYAKTCYYANSDNRVLMSYDTNSQNFTIEKRDLKTNLGKENLTNNNKEITDGKTNIKVEAIDGSNCPSYVVYRHNSNFIGSDTVYGFKHLDEATAFKIASNEIKTKIDAWTLTIINVTPEEFELMKENNFEYTNDVTCDGIFGEKDDPESLRYLLNEIMMYPKIIVPIIVLGLGTLDFAKAVIASKEENMKKAQATFVKRVLIGITIFFVPTIMNLIMYLADIVWNGAFTTCGI